MSDQSVWPKMPGFKPQLFAISERLCRFFGLNESTAWSTTEGPIGRNVVTTHRVATTDPQAETPHPEFPLQRLCILRDSLRRAEFAREASSVIVPGELAELHAVGKGLVLLAQNQAVQARLIGLLQSVYRDSVEFGPLEIRYRDQDGVRTEPYMALRVECRTERLGAVIEDLAWREASVLDRQSEGARSVLRATAPLALLLGYPTLLARIDNSATLTSRLAFYARVGSRATRGQP
jgi:hypothetical protein